MNEDLLERARTAGARLEKSEREVVLARADYHAAVRRLHLSGATLREVAESLAISHQRVQQIVDRAGGSWWRRVWRTRKTCADAVCTWCGRPPSEVAKLIAGPDVFICDACTLAAEALAAGKRSTPPFTGATTKGIASRCSFCGKGPTRKRPVVTAPAARVCADCLRVCREILDSDSTNR